MSYNNELLKAYDAYKDRNGDLTFDLFRIGFEEGWSAAMSSRQENDDG